MIPFHIFVSLDFRINPSLCSMVLTLFSHPVVDTWQCHYSYNACGLGSDGTERLVNLVQEMQHRKTPENGGPNLYGAKITGGGSGGSVCVIGKNCLQSAEEIAEVIKFIY